MTVELHALQLAQINIIEIVLKNMGCSYKIKLPNGNVIQSEPIKPATPKRVRMYPYNEVRNYYRPFVADVQPGQITYVPLDKYPPSYLQKHLCSHLCSIWGSGTYTTHIDADNNRIEVLRTDGL